MARLIPSHHECPFADAWNVHIAKEYAQLCLSHGEHSYAKLRALKPGCADDDRIACALDVSRMHWGIGNPVGREQPEQQLPLAHPFYELGANREKLQRVLSSLAIRKRRVGYNANLARFSSLMLCSLRQEKRAFTATVVIYDRLCLDDYFLGDGEPLVRDIEVIVGKAKELWPSLEDVLRLRNGGGALKSLIRSWLSSLMAVFFDANQQPLSQFSALMDILVTSASSDSDPRYMLRHIVLFVLGHCRAELECAVNYQTLVDIVEKLTYHVQVSQPLIELVRANIATEDYARLFGYGLAPLGLATGYFSSLAACNVIYGTAGIASSIGCLVPGALCMGVAMKVGATHGIRLAQVVTAELQQVLAGIEADSDKTAERKPHVKTQAPTLVDQKEWEPDLDFFLWRHSGHSVSHILFLGPPTTTTQTPKPTSRHSVSGAADDADDHDADAQADAWGSDTVRNLITLAINAASSQAELGVLLSELGGPLMQIQKTG